MSPDAPHSPELAPQDGPAAPESPAADVAGSTAERPANSHTGLPSPLLTRSEVAGSPECVRKGHERGDQRQRLVGERLGAKAGVPLCHAFVLGFDDHQDAADLRRHPNAAQGRSQQELSAESPTRDRLVHGKPGQQKTRNPVASEPLVLAGGTTSCATEAGVIL